MYEASLCSDSADLETEFDHICHPCKDDGDTREADGYCSDCHVYLCCSCYKYHKKLPALRDHILLDRSEMPNEEGQTTYGKDVCSEKCAEHGGKIIEYFCPGHVLPVFGCTVCITISHKTCDGVVYIPEVSKTIMSSGEYGEVVTEMDNISERWQNRQRDAEEKLRLTEQICAQAFTDVEEFKNKAIQALNNMVSSIKMKAEKIKQKDVERLEKESEECKAAVTKLQEISSSFHTYASNGQYCNLFTEIKTAKQKINQLICDGETVDYISTCFQFRSKLTKVIDDPNTFGELWLPQTLQATKITDIPLRVGNESKEIVTGFALMPENKLVITTSLLLLNRVKLFDIQLNRKSSETIIYSKPWSVAVVSDNLVGITLPNAKTIAFIEVDKELSVKEEIKVTGKCWGIACFEEKLAVSYTEPSKMEIIDMTGQVLKIFHKDEQGRELFQEPLHVAISVDNQIIYVSEVSSNAVIGIKQNGKIVSRYQDGELKRPRQIAVDQTGTVFVVGQESMNIHVLGSDLTKMKILLQVDRGNVGSFWKGVSDFFYSRKPLFIGLCDVTNRLYVVRENFENVEVYSLISD